MVGGESLCGTGRGHWARCLVCFGSSVGIAVERWVNERETGTGMGNEYAFLLRNLVLGREWE